MKSHNSLIHSSKSFRFFIAGLFLSIACILFITSQIYDRWGTFPTPHPNLLSTYSGIWCQNIIQNGTSIIFKIKCANERISCTNVFISRIFMIATCITSGIGTICLCLLPIFKNKSKSIICMIGLCLAILSFIFGLIGFVFGLAWIYQFFQDKIAVSAISVLIGSLFSLVSAICIYFINIQELM